ncbi:MAG: DUF1641 domain-containing protein [Chloroflexi bacterium]|nr:DUF1641 domain-containing protein [Chloroflexota bacterium]
MEQQLIELNRKIDQLTEQVAYLAEDAYEQRRRRQEWDDLKNDLTPVMGEVYRLSVEQLDEVEQYVQLEDGLRLLKRLMRNTRNLEQLLDQMESLADFSYDVSPLSQEAFLAVMSRLNEMEQKGYFTLLRGGMEIFDEIVTSFTAEDVKQLGENIVLILQTVKQMTQPELMRMMQHTAVVMREEEPLEDISMFAILRQLNDPSVKRGLAKTLTVLKTVSDN